MGRRPRWYGIVGLLMIGALWAGALPASAMRGKPWAQLAPAPLASDSAYAALGARPEDSLSVSELAWLDVQRDWRRQRAEEAEPMAHGITGTGRAHHVRANDGRFAELASRPYDALSESERAWLMIESNAQRAELAHAGQESTTAGLVSLALIAGAIAGAVIAAHAFADGLAQAFGHI